MASARRLSPRLGLALCWGLALAAAAPAQDLVLRGEFWADFQAVPAAGDPWPADEATVSRRLLDEAAYVFSGMSSGFDFEWSPSDKTRAIAESFSLKPRSPVDPGDPRLQAGQMKRLGEELYASVSYAPSPAEVLSIASYGREPWRSAQGTGKVDFIRGVRGRFEAYEDAARDAVSGLLRSLSPNKPRRVRGRLVFAEPPRLVLSGGFYTVSLKARVEITELLGYELY